MNRESTLLRFLEQRLVTCQLPSGGWGFGRHSSQPALEPTCLSLLALRARPDSVPERGLRFLLHAQNPNGSWPAFGGDDRDGCWATALAVTALVNCAQVTPPIDRGLGWLLKSRGRESHWLWKWKFRTADTRVRFNPDKFGWPWIPGTCSWVVPTAFSLLALKHNSVCCPTREVSFRIECGVEMLLDRACPDGGWNAGNGVVYGVPLAPHLDATAAALLALRGEQPNEIIATSLDWLEQRTGTCSAPWSLAWSILALDAHGRSTEAPIATLAAISGTDAIDDCATIAVVLLALGCSIEGNVFRVTS
ncbi:MAG TPA: prenyltransferase/squalene oxidase repeat-containing protein [Terriglobia bacterium]|jgi:squalene cyclase|nr:prenyltransferase/squalene oxidase repeat-containing protein [Terriglobia bacterium]